MHKEVGYAWMEDFSRVMGEVRVLMQQRKYVQACREFIRYARRKRSEDLASSREWNMEDCTPLASVLPTRMANGLESRGYVTIGSVRNVPDSELLSCRNVGLLSLAKIREVAPYVGIGQVAGSSPAGLYESDGVVYEGPEERKRRDEVLADDRLADMEFAKQCRESKEERRIRRWNKIRGG